MPKNTYLLPQVDEPIQIITFAALIDKLPEVLAYPINVWIGGDMARYGQSSKGLIFLVEQEEETSTEMKMYFGELIYPWSATVSEAWRNEKVSAVRLYNEGNLIIDKMTMTYRELPSPTTIPPVIKLDNVLQKLPKEVKWKNTIYLTGSLVKFGWSGNDVDFMVDGADSTLYKEIRNYFEKVLQCKVDVGNASMPEREPIYKYKIYEEGLWQA